MRSAFTINEERNTPVNASSTYYRPSIAARDFAVDESVPVKILLVDDHPENLLALEATLARSGGPKGIAEPIRAQFIRAGSGEEALRRILEDSFAAILLDVQMPGMDGYETAELIRQRQQTQLTPIIFLTAISTSDAQISRGYALGAVDYITKPFDPWVLKAKVGVFVDLYRKRKEIERMAEALRTQSEELRRLNEGLERRVLERTEELEIVNQDLWNAKESAELANSAKDKFLAVLSHELRTPLTPVLAIVQMLVEDQQVSSETKTWIETIGRNVQLEARLIDDLLDLTRIVNGKLELHLEPVDLHQLIQQTVDICEDEIHAKQQLLRLELNAKNPQVRADSARLQQVLWNLLKNAVKFTPGSGTIIVRTFSTEEGKVSFQVSDTGIGIPKEHLATVFHAFDQGSKAITRRFGGLGLGLAISKALIEQHGGTIRAESEGTEKGATFVVELPTVTELPLPAQNNNHTSDSLPHPRSRILLVEDNADTSRAMQVLLERNGYAVTVARSVESALELSQKNPFDLVVSDIGLPDGDGFEVMRRMNQLRPTHGIAISGYGMDEDRRRSLEAGFNAHLVKPINFGELSRIARQLLEQR